jgi:hypothetical protein
MMPLLPGMALNSASVARPGAPSPFVHQLAAVWAPHSVHAPTSGASDISGRLEPSKAPPGPPPAQASASKGREGTEAVTRVARRGGSAVQISRRDRCIRHSDAGA